MLNYVLNLFLSRTDDSISLRNIIRMRFSLSLYPYLSLSFFLFHPQCFHPTIID